MSAAQAGRSDSCAMWPGNVGGRFHAFVSGVCGEPGAAADRAVCRGSVGIGWPTLKGGKQMTQAQGRAWALGAARYYLRQLQINPVEATAEQAHKALDDYARCYRNAYPSQWYHAATDEQLDLFYADWRRWQHKQRQLLMGG